jgi:hypothetical protein
VTPFIFGNDSLRSCLATLGYTGEKSNPQPELIFKCPFEQSVRVYYASPLEIVSVYAEYELLPFESKSVIFNLHPAAPLIRKNEIILSSDYWDSVHIVPSKSCLEFNSSLDCYTAEACIVNLTKKYITGTVEGSWEIVRNYKQYNIDKCSVKSLSVMLQKFPLAKRILQQKDGVTLNIPLLTVQNVSLQPTEDRSLITEDMSEILGGSKISYTGTAEITPNIIDAGLEVPTQIYQSPEEALNLDLFEPHREGG